METLTCFEVETLYLSGRTRSEVIVSASEESMWEYYDKHHNSALIENCVIADAWCA